MIKLSEFNIISESPKDHWSELNVHNKVVLDLGCGRWDAKILEDTTPHYFIQQGASKVIGIDIQGSEVEYMKNVMIKNCDFFQQNVNNSDILRKIIQEHKISIIKMDIEGNEIILCDMLSDDFINVEAIGVEYHLNTTCETIVNALANLGFKSYIHGKLWVMGMGVIFATK